VIHTLRTALIVTYTLVLGPVASVTAILDRSGEAALSIARLWVRMILFTCGIRVETSGLANIDPLRSSVYMSNHQSFVDVAVILATLPVSVRFIAKRELAKVPVFGWGMALGGHLLVDRGSRSKVMASLNAGAELLKRGPSLCVFPEGSRSLTGEMSKFKNGGFQIAMLAGAPIVPISIVGSGQLAPKTTLGIDSGIVKISYGPPIPTQGLEPQNRVELKKQVREAILSGIQSLEGTCAG
jgi:1-acyl-sn-glycerol-3-phosphate acyltransferase